jgi:ketosteroid isomerase-like protein
MDGMDEAATAAHNRELVERYRAAFSSFDPDRYGPFLAHDPVYHAGMTQRRGRAAVDANTGAGRVLYPYGALRSTTRRVVADGDWVAELIEREAITNADAHYENVYAMFYEVRDDRIATQVELLDFRVAAAKFDLGALDPPADPGVRQAPTEVAAQPAADDDSPGAEAIRTVLAFLDAFLSFDPDRFVDRLVADPLHQVGMTHRSGREAFLGMAAAGRVLYPDGIAQRTHHVLVSDGTTVATLCSLRARTHIGVDYENLYGMFVDVHEGRVAALVEVYDTRVADAAFDLSVLTTR